MTSIPVKKLEPDAILPTRATAGSAGYDLYSYQDGILLSGCQVLISTKIAMEIPNGYCGLIWPRSGLSVKKGIETGAGVIDSDYRGEVCVVLHNHSNETFIFKKGMRIAQLLITPIATPIILEIDSLNESKRGDGGFGSTGLK